MSRRGYANLAEDMDEIFDKSPNDESPNVALSQALGTPEYGGRVRGVGGFITPTVYFHQAKPRKSNKVDTTQQIIDENQALRKRIQELEQKVQNIPTSKHENVVKEKKEITTSVPSISPTSKKKVVEEEEVKEEEVIVTRPSISKNEVKALRPMTKEVEVTSEPSNLPIQLKYILRYDERCPLQVGIVKCGYYVMRYMREIVSKDTNIITDAIDRRNSYSQLELDEIQVEWAEFLTRKMIRIHAREVEIS
uniref:CACTA en-spm transposon protein n=1 Tax=Cucumis melo TaxID=3656 RepID=A0A9I9EJK5_CUCME